MTQNGKRFSRRDFLRVSGAAGGFAVLAAAGCSAPAAAPEAAPAAERRRTGCSSTGTNYNSDQRVTVVRRFLGHGRQVCRDNWQ